MNLTTYVAAALILRGDRILIAQRETLLWEFPGGKREPGESFENCLIRECREELEVEIEVGELFMRTDYDYPEYSVRLLFFKAKIRSGVLKMDVHSATQWVPRGELGRYEFCPADRDVVKKLAQEKRSAR